MSEVKKYRKNVAAVVLNDEGKMLVCQRADKHRSWQFPQGGVDEGESLQQAVYRELLEEIGTNELELIGALDTPLRYDWPHKYAPIPGFHGQEQYYFLFRLKPAAVIDLQYHAPHEFRDYCWSNVKDFFSLEIGFKKEAYERALLALCANFPGLIQQ